MGHSPSFLETTGEAAFKSLKKFLKWAVKRVHLEERRFITVVDDVLEVFYKTTGMHPKEIS